MFFGGSNYLGGNAGVFSNHTGLNGLAIGGGLYNHPSFTMNRGINYFAGAGVPNQPPLPNDMYMPAMANSVQGLQACLNTARDEQGILGRFWDGIKNVTGIGLGSNKCQQYIDKAATGQMSVQDAFSKICKYTTKQRGGVNVISGLAAGTLSALAVGAAPLTGGMSVLAAAGIGAAAKAGLKTIDRATNEIDNDALDAKKIMKDGLSGALNGITTKAVMVKQAGHVFNVQSAKEALKQGAIQGAKCGAISGAAISGGDYLLECGFEKDQKFSADDFITNTIYGGLTGGLIGGVTGGITTRSAYNKYFGPQYGQGGQNYNYWGPNPDQPNGPRGPQPSGGQGGNYRGLGGSTTQPNPAGQYSTGSTQAGGATGNIIPNPASSNSNQTSSVLGLPDKSNPVYGINSPDIIDIINPYNTLHIAGKKAVPQLPAGKTVKQLSAPPEVLGLPKGEALGLPGPIDGMQTPAVANQSGSAKPLLGLPAPKEAFASCVEEFEPTIPPPPMGLSGYSDAMIYEMQRNALKSGGLQTIASSADKFKPAPVLGLPEYSSATLNRMQTNAMSPNVLQQNLQTSPQINPEIQAQLLQQGSIADGAAAAEQIPIDLRTAPQPKVKQGKTKGAEGGNGTKPDKFIKNLVGFLKDKLKH